ncbi:hypothetical protein CJ030_MR2G013626 [Morella rubra]|uniref:TVP38/TMEM64 family membrane protein slr0305 n=1 Tax=Morella rubra TaxID=262757 RepID=A0A6A1WC64_9ROSI|nr:hypothetical protein CJ030_MR2G013626 [Morella rubra]
MYCVSFILYSISSSRMLGVILKDFLLWVKQDLGPWGPLVLAVAYIPLTVLAVPASVLTLGGGYLFGLPVGIVADSIGATVGAGAAFLGRTEFKRMLMCQRRKILIGPCLLCCI